MHWTFERDFAQHFRRTVDYNGSSRLFARARPAEVHSLYHHLSISEHIGYLDPHQHLSGLALSGDTDWPLKYPCRLVLGQPVAGLVS